MEGAASPETSAFSLKAHEIPYDLFDLGRINYLVYCFFRNHFSALL